MSALLLKGVISGVLVVVASEAARRSPVLAAVLVSLPLTSILALFWLYRDTGDIAAVSAFSTSILWIVLPSVVLFVALPLLLRAGVGFYLALALSCVVMIVAYAMYATALRAAGIGR